MSHYVLFTGGREPDPDVRDDIAAVLRLLKGLHGSELRVMHGAGRGVDSMVDEECQLLGIRCKGFPADWDRLGASAGPERNKRMVTLLVSWLSAGHTAQVVALPGGSGTAHCADTAERCGLDVSRLTPTS